MHRWAAYATCWLFDCRGQTFMNKDVLGLLKATESRNLLALPSFIKAAITVCGFCLTTCKIIPVWKKGSQKAQLKGCESMMMHYDRSWEYWDVLILLKLHLYSLWGLKKHQLHLHHLVYCICPSIYNTVYTVWLASNIDVLCYILVKDIFYRGPLLDSTNLHSGFGEFCWVSFVIYLTQ